MPASLYSLLGFVFWTLMLLGAIAVVRTMGVLTGKKASNDFPADQDHGGSPFYRRLLRAHMNCVENLPVYGAVILTAAVLGVTALIDPLAWPFLGCRVAQSLAHLAGTSVVLVNVRFTFFLAQYVILLTMIGRLAT